MDTQVRLSIGAVSLLCSLGLILSIAASLPIVIGEDRSLLMAEVSAPFMATVAVGTLDSERRMARGWNSFLVSSGIGRSAILSSMVLPMLSATLLTDAVLLCASASGGCLEAAAFCLAVDTAIVLTSSVAAVLCFSASGSSMPSELIGMASFAAIAVASYLYRSGPFDEGYGASFAAAVVAIAIFAAGWKASSRAFGRLDL